MTPPNYALLDAYDDGVSAARNFIIKRGKYAMTRWPVNPFMFENERRLAWDDGFNSTMKKHGDKI